jgi:hypothetical protein
MPKNKTTEIEQEVKIPIKWHTPDNMVTRYATNMLVQTIENEFKISFFEIIPEIRLDPNSPPPKEVRADCVAKVIVSPEKLPSIIKALQDQYDKYIEIKSKKLKS